MDKLFQTIREACSKLIWSKAVELVRTSEFAAAASQHCVTVNIISQESAVQPIVTLFVEDQDWQCTCSSDESPCHHVAAAIIAIRRAREKGQELPAAAETTGRLEYQFYTQDQRLLLRRIITGSGDSQPLMSTLSALTTGRIKGPKLISTPADMEIDVIIGSDRSGSVALRQIPRLLRLLLDGDCTVRLDGQAVTLSPEPAGMKIMITDDGPGIRVQARPSENLKKIYNNGYAVLGPGVLHPAVLPESSQYMADLLRAGIFYGRQSFGSFVSDILPELQLKYPVSIKSNLLPKQGYNKPTIELNLADCYPAGMQVTVSIVYGDPVDTRITDGRIKNFGNRVSIRSPDEELFLKDELWRSVNLEPGPPVLLPPPEALALVAKLARFKGDLTGDGYQAWSVKGEVQPHADWQDELPGFSFALKGAGSPSASAESVVAAWSKNEPLVRLTGGGFGTLPESWLAQNGEVLSWLHAAKEQKEIGNAAKQSMIVAVEALGLTPPPMFKEMKKRFLAVQKPTGSLPVLNADLRPYQQTGIEWLHTLTNSRQGGILADDMGLGKTLQAISLLTKPSLVVAPTSVVFNWHREIEKFRPQLKVCVYHGKDREMDDKSDVIITSYNLIRMFPDAFTRDWHVIIADEAQFMKNPESQIFSAMRALKAQARFALTGTPVENRLDDLWAQMDFVNPGLLGSRRYFSELIGARINKGDEQALHSLRQRIKPFFLRRLKTEVAKDLPSRTNIIQSIELSEPEQGLYKTLLLAAKGDIARSLTDKKKGGALHILEMLLRLRQACCHPDLLPHTTGYASAKVDFAADMAMTLVEEQHKILIFSQWTSYLDLIQTKFQSLGLATLRLDGSTTNRQEVVDRFQEPDTERILLMSLKAGGTGLNLTAADHVFIMDPWWNPAAEEQASNRAWRIGQDKPVFVHKLVAAGTIEEKILQLQEAKQKLSDAVTGGDFDEAPTLNEILQILED